MIDQNALQSMTSRELGELFEKAAMPVLSRMFERWGYTVVKGPIFYS